MVWGTGWPPVNGETNIQDWDWRIKNLNYALDERGRVFGEEWFPKTSLPGGGADAPIARVVAGSATATSVALEYDTGVMDSGTATAATNSSLTDGGKSWATNAFLDRIVTLNVSLPGSVPHYQTILGNTGDTLNYTAGSYSPLEDVDLSGDGSNLFLFPDYVPGTVSVTYSIAGPNWVPCVFTDGFWTTATGHSLPGAPSSYDIVFHVEGDDARYIIRSPITANSGGNVVTVADLSDQLTAIDRTLADLDECPAIIIPAYGWSRKDRLPPCPNQEYDTGLVSAGTTTTLTQTPSHKWEIDEHAGDELLYYGAGPKLYRVVIVSNTEDTLTFAAGVAPVADTAWSVVPPGGVAYPGFKAQHLNQWNTSDLVDLWGTRFADESLGGTPMPALTFKYAIWGGASCDPQAFFCFDADFWTAADEEHGCHQTDFCFTPKYYHSLRSIQSYLLRSLCTRFVEAKDYNGFDLLNGIHNLTIAEWLKAADINPVSIPWTNDTEVPQTLYYTVTKDDGSVRVSTNATSGDGNSFENIYAVGVGATVTAAHLGAESGDSAIGSLAYSRMIPRWFRFMYDHIDFLPDSSTVDGHTTVHDPARVLDWDTTGSFGMGKWVWRPKSTCYREPNDLGHTQTVDETVPFVEEELATHVGSNWSDTTIPDVDPDSPEWVLAPYYDRFAEMKELSPLPTTGKITRATEWFIEDSSANDWPDGVMRTENLVATGGSTTSFIDTTKLPAAGAASASWEAIRFPSFPGGSWYTFILEVDKDFTGTDLAVDATNPLMVTSASRDFVSSDVGMTLDITGGSGWPVASFQITAVVSGAAILDAAPAALGSTGGQWALTTTFYVPVVTGNPATAELAFTAVDALTVEASDVGRIREPYELNRRRERILKVIQSDGTIVRLPITHSDDKRRYFEPQDEPFEVGCSYEIEELIPGPTYLRRSGKWIKPPIDEHDPRDTANPTSTWPDNQRTIRPTWAKRYGRIRNNDLLGGFIFGELQRGINALRWTLGGATWTNADYWYDPRGNHGAATLRSFEGSEAGSVRSRGADGDRPYADAQGSFNAGLASGGDPHWEAFGSSDNAGAGPPFSITSATFITDIGESTGSITPDSPPYSTWGLFMSAERSRCRASGWATRLPSDTMFLGFSTIKKTFDGSSLDPADCEYDPGTSLAEDVWTVFETSPVGREPVRTSAMIGSIELIPNWPASPDTSTGGTKIRGGGIIAQCAITRWDVTGGLTFI